MDRRSCTHSRKEPVVVLLSWCERCSGWGYSRLGVPPGSYSELNSLEVYESHFLPAEELTPDEGLHLMMRAFRAAQEWGQDAYEQEELPLT